MKLITQERYNPVLTAAIDFYYTTVLLDLACSIAEEFRLSTKKADVIIAEVAAAVQEWKTIARSFGISQKECDRMQSAFKTT